MNVGITSDAWWETRVGEVVNIISIRSMRDEFYSRSYGNDINDIFLVLMCRQPEYNFKQRVRFIKNEKVLYADIMLDFDVFMNIDQEQRKKKVFNQILVELPIIISRYKFKDFNTKQFIADLANFFNKVDDKSDDSSV